MSSKADNVQTAILLFSKYDTDGNGSISKEELKAMLLRKCEDEGIAVDMSLVEKQVNEAKFFTNTILLWDMHFS
jgi:Ca2+-binding EF-hand superfamily protein